ncbi:MAG: hypothetical protein F8N37_17655 [Telmatospirillum sp.]|nr:hypothetical protein [Telmatospirillum sp.]
MVGQTPIRHPVASVLPAVCLGLFSLIWIFQSALGPRPDEPVAAIFPPWTSPEAAVLAMASADAGAILGFGRWPNVIIAQSPDPGFASRLRRSGALIVTRAPRLTGCMQ